MSTIRTFASKELGLTLHPGQAEMVREFEQGRYSQAIWQCGRRAGKSLLSDVLALFDVTARDHLRKRLRPGEPRVSAIVAPRLDQAQRHIATCAQLIRKSRHLKAMLVGQGAEELVFANGSVIRAYPCSARSIRGEAWSSCILDEFGHFLTSEDGNAAGDRILEAATPSLAQFGSEGWLIAISTPLWRAGAFWKLAERAQSGRFPSMHYAHKTTTEMNPRIPADWLEEQRRQDPDLYAREFEARFIDGASSYLVSADVVACVRHGRGTLPPQPRVHYAGALDPAYSHDFFTMAVAHSAEGVSIVDGIWAWHRAGHETTLDAVADVARQYGIRSLRTDQHCAQPIREGLSRRQVAMDYQPWTTETKANAFAALKLGLNARTVELPDDSALIEELCRLEARPSPAGFTRIAAAGGRDDRAVAVASVLSMTSRSSFSDYQLDQLFEQGHGETITGSGPDGGPLIGDIFRRSF